MHTIFINTTKNVIGGRIDALKLQKETKKLLYVECPLASWYDEQKGYESCVREIGEIIDTYNNVSNSFNLIVYADLSEIAKHLGRSLSNDDSITRTATYEAYKRTVARFFTATIYSSFVENERVPEGKMLLLLEQPKIEIVNYGNQLNGGEISLYEEAEIEATLYLLGILPLEKIEEKVALWNNSSDYTPKLTDILYSQRDDASSKLRQIYEKNIEVFFKSVFEDKVKLIVAALDFCKSIKSLFVSDSKSVAISDYLTKGLIKSINKEVSIKQNFLLQCFILDCVKTESLFEEKGDKIIPKTVPKMDKEKWEKVMLLLAEKQKCYEKEKNEIDKISADFTELGLAPNAYVFDHQKFGLDEDGTLDIEYLIAYGGTDEEEENSKEEAAKGESEEQEEKDALIEKKIRLAKKDIVIENWFTADEFEVYDSNGDKYTSDASGLLTADEYCEKAKDLANHHLKFINKLNKHISTTMSRYAGRSLSNAPATLRKRNVNTFDTTYDVNKNDFKYAKKGNNGFVKETAPPESFVDTSKRAYVTILLEFLKFVAGRSVTVSTIKEQCDWFMNRVKQIEESLKKLLMLFVVMASFLVFLYIPFVLIQWEAITKNIDTFVIALGSVAAPFVLLVACYFIAREIQRRKMKKEWEKLLEISKDITAENKRVVETYDDFLCKYTPALRWVYEYLLDVDFHCECCRVALAKLNHHREKLFEQSELIENVLEDLDFENWDAVKYTGNCKVDYTKAFCKGDNSDFYSVIDPKLLEYIYERGETLE